MGVLTIIKKQKANDHYGESNWKTFYCMKDDEGNYKAYDNNKHATLANTDEFKKFNRVFKDTSWDECKGEVTLGGLSPCNKIKSDFDEQKNVKDGWGTRTMGVEWKQNPQKSKLCDVWGECSVFNGCCEHPENKLGTCYTYDLVKPSK